MAVVDIIIRSKDGHELLQTAVSSIVELTKREDYRMIVVDDGSQPALITPELLSQSPLHYLRHPEPRGAVSATNTGLTYSLNFDDSPYVLVMDNDTQIPDGDDTWLDRFVAEMEQAGPKFAAMGATSDFSQVPQHILGVPQTYTADWKNEKTGQFGEKDNPPMIWFISFAVLLRKDAVRQIGLWDERYNPGNWEDTDYSLQLRKNGYCIGVARSVYIHHWGHQTFRDEMKELIQTNKRKFLQKWGAGTIWDMGMMKDHDLAAVLRNKAGA